MGASLPSGIAACFRARYAEKRVRVSAPSGKAETVRFTSTGEEWGVFHGHFTAAEPGKHQVMLTCKQTGATLETSVFVQGTSAERIGRPARPEVLEEIAYGGRAEVRASWYPSGPRL